jgi:hypothetical protein
MTCPHRRYVLRQELDGSWSVIDAFTGAMPRFGELTVEFQDEESARKLCDLINAADIKRRSTG